jgi:hypothetical protein
VEGRTVRHNCESGFRGKDLNVKNQQKLQQAYQTANYEKTITALTSLLTYQI